MACHLFCLVLYCNWFRWMVVVIHSTSWAFSLFRVCIESVLRATGDFVMIIKPKRNQIKIIWIVKRIKIPINQRSLWLELLNELAAFFLLFIQWHGVKEFSRLLVNSSSQRDPCSLFRNDPFFFIRAVASGKRVCKKEPLHPNIPYTLCFYFCILHIFDHLIFVLIFFCFVFAFTDECIFRARFTNYFNFIGRFCVFIVFSFLHQNVYKNPSQKSARKILWTKHQNKQQKNVPNLQASGISRQVCMLKMCSTFSYIKLNLMPN